MKVYKLAVSDKQMKLIREAFFTSYDKACYHAVALYADKLTLLELDKLRSLDVKRTCMNKGTVTVFAEAIGFIRIEVVKVY